MSDEVRKIGGYEITNSIHIGDRELILGENMQAPDGMFYMTCEVEANELFERYNEAMVSDNFIDVAKIYSDRLQRQIVKTQADLSSDKIPYSLITADQCNLDIFKEHFGDKILVIKPSALRSEYRRASQQIIRCTGGNGANPKGLGSAVYCNLLATGEHTRFERSDVMGELKPEFYPEWLNEKIRINDFIKHNPSVFKYGNNHFLPVGVVDKGFKYISKNIATDTNLGMWNKLYNKKRGKSKSEYSHKDFYKACGDISCDVFMCVENGNIYLPGENEMFLYTGDFKDYPGNLPQKTKPDKEVER